VLIFYKLKPQYQQSKWKKNEEIKYSFVVIVIAATSYLFYQSQRAYLISEIVGLTAYEQTLFKGKTTADYWAFMKSHQGSDPYLKSFKLRSLKKRLKISTKNDRLIFKLSASDFENPRYTKLLARVVALTQQYLDYKRTVEASRLKEEAEGLKKDYLGTQRRESNYYNANRELTSSAFNHRMTALKTRLQGTKDALKKLKRQAGILRSLENDPEFSLQNVDVDLSAVKKYRRLEEQYEENRTRYRAKHPKMLNIQGELAALKGIIFETLNRRRTLLRSQLKKIRASMAALNREKSRSANVRKQLGALHAAKLKTKNTYEATVKTYAELRNRGIYQVIAPQLSGGALASAPKAAKLFGGFFLFILMGVGLFLIFNRKIYDPRHISKHDISLLAVMPKLKKDQRIPLHAHYQPNSFYSKSMTLVRNRLLSQFHKKPAVLLVSSASKTRGPVSPTANLCISLAQSQKRVLLIDCQIKNAAQHKFFRVDNEGLAEILHDGINASQLITKVEVPNLSILAAGQGLTLKSLCSDNFDALLRECRGNYDFVILDAPPLSLETDSVLISQRTDGVILTIPTGKVTKQTLVWVKSELKRANVPLIGVILKDVAADLAEEWNKFSVSKPTTTV